LSERWGLLIKFLLKPQSTKQSIRFGFQMKTDMTHTIKLEIPMTKEVCPWVKFGIKCLPGMFCKTQKANGKEEIICTGEPNDDSSKIND